MRVVAQILGKEVWSIRGHSNHEGGVFFDDRVTLITDGIDNLYCYYNDNDIYTTHYWYEVRFHPYEISEIAENQN